VRRPLHPDNPLSTKLNEIRATIADLKQRLATLAAAPVTLPELRKRATALVDANIRHATLDALNPIAYYSPDGREVDYPILTGAHWLLLDRAEHEKRIVAYLSSTLPEGTQPSTAARLKAIDSTKEEIRQLEIDEEIEVLERESENWAPARRSDIDAGIVLETWNKLLVEELSR